MLWLMVFSLYFFFQALNHWAQGKRCFYPEVTEADGVPTCVSSFSGFG